MVDLLSQNEIDALMDTIESPEEEGGKEKSIDQTIIKGKGKKTFKASKPQSLRFSYPYKSPVIKADKIIVTEDKEEYNTFRESTSKDRYYDGTREIVVLKLNF